MAGSLAQRLVQELQALGATGDTRTWLVAGSGGVDSMVLLHLLREAALAPLHVGHVDHAMRPGSEADASWLRGVCHAWGVPFSSRRLDPPPTSEATARAARYAVLDQWRDQLDAAFVVTAHHADDQAETVLFRAIRGTGVDGLAGIRPRSDGRLRPLLGVEAAELVRYAEEVGLRWREDPTNQDETLARNALRHDVLPRLEAISPRAGRALARLAANALDDRAAWLEAQSLLGDVLGVEASDGRLSVSRADFVALGPELRARLLRGWATDVGATLDRAGTLRGDAFVLEGESGHGVDLGGAVTLHIELDRIVLRRARAKAGEPDAPVRIESPVQGAGEARLAGRSVPVAWAAHTHVLQRSRRPGAREARFSIDELSFPLTVRGRRPGDRIALPGGTRKVKKVLLDARIPSDSRDAVPVLVDHEGSVLWVPGVARSRIAEAGGRMLTVRIGP